MYRHHLLTAIPQRRGQDELILEHRAPRHHHILLIVAHGALGARLDPFKIHHALVAERVSCHTSVDNLFFALISRSIVADWQLVFLN
jgi:hypothetical protein